jgi:hypothetical protein
MAAMRTQPLHEGHTRILNRMIADFETAILMQGSADKHGTRGNPWHVEVREQMVRNVYHKRIKLVPVADLGTTEGTGDWCQHLLNIIGDMGLPSPTDYFTGSQADAMWYKSHFWDGPTDHPILFMPEQRRYWLPHDPNLRPRDISNEYLSSDATLRRLHIVERSASQIPSATELRTFLDARDDGWKQWVPGVNHELVESTYPEEFRVKFKD